MKVVFPEVDVQLAQSRREVASAHQGGGGERGRSRVLQRCSAEAGPIARVGRSRARCNPSEEIARLRAKVAQLESVANHAPRCSAEAAEAVKMRAAKRRARCIDDSLPNDEQAVSEWVDSKMLELRDATDLGDMESVVTLTNLIGQGASKKRSSTRLPSTLSNMVVSMRVKMRVAVNPEARCGHRRVHGEVQVPVIGDERNSELGRQLWRVLERTGSSI